MPTWIHTRFQDNVSPSMEHILFFHDHAIIILTLIVILTFYVLICLLTRNIFNKYIIEGQEIETIWTILPAGILMFIAFPSLKTLYLIEDTKSPAMTIKSTGHQWYWTYEYSRLNFPEVERFMSNSEIFRLLKTEATLQLPVNTSIRNIVSSADVIHSWTIPSIGVKTDALPGRLNQIFLISKRMGLFTGQCSEICGRNHSFIPILVQVKNTKNLFNSV